MSTGTKTVIALVILGVIDMVIPVPVLGIILIYVVIQRPPWFINTVREIYDINV